MDSYELPFAKILIHREDIAEVIKNEGVEIDVAMVEQYHEFLNSHLTKPFSLLINRINSYAYDFDAQVKLGQMDGVAQIAVVTYNPSSEMIVKSWKSTFQKDAKWELNFFTSRDEALNWLKSRPIKSLNTSN